MRRPAVVSALLCAGVFACTPEPTVVPPVTECIDGDQDGYDSCIDCDDAEASVHPGAAERCNGKDDNCDKVVDEGCACRDGDEPRPCGAEGGNCTQACEGGALGECLPPSGESPALDSDVLNCGECGRVCPTPVHAAPRCSQGVCGRGPCERGYFDFDGSVTPGCEVFCEGNSCSDEEGQDVPVDDAPVPETGHKHGAVTSGSSYGGAVQTTPEYTNTGSLGASVSGALVSTNGTYKNYGGFTAAERK